MFFGITLGFFSSHVSAATKEISEISPGSVVSVNGVKFVKLNNNNEFVAVAPSVCPYFATGMYMQDFTSQMCATAPTPSGTDYFPIGVLTDRRDNKKYEVRKFADGNCWMVDNLAYGGSDLNNGEDGCLKTSYCGLGYKADGTCVLDYGGAIAIVDKIAPGLYGDCRYPYEKITIADDNKYGYLYSGQAATQNPDVRNGFDYQPAQPVQGICPDGWYLPTGGDNGQFQALYLAAGSPVTSFWQSGESWNASYAGSSIANGRIDVVNRGFYWSSTQRNLSGNFVLNVDSTGTNNCYATDTCAGSKDRGVAISCLKTP